ncbi:hypothetical protein CC80DRAFT_415164, partial [Byssothecium circinans]
IKDKTTILVPAVINVGEGPNGFFVTTELINGVPLAKIGNKCKTVATANAKTFVEEIVIPQLRELKSNTTRFNGVVIPPPWTLATPEFVFCHGDLGPFNIMVDPLTLKVKAVFNLENRGFYPGVFLK